MYGVPILAQGIFYYIFIPIENMFLRGFFFLPKITSHHNHSRNSTPQLQNLSVCQGFFIRAQNDLSSGWCLLLERCHRSRLAPFHCTYDLYDSVQLYGVIPWDLIYILRISSFSHPTPGKPLRRGKAREDGLFPLIYCGQMEGMPREKNRNHSSKKYRL